MEEQKTSEAPAAAPAKGKGMWIGVVVVAIVVIILLAAVFGGLFGAPPTEEPNQLRIGTLLSLTGRLSPFGPGNERGAKMAIGEINDAGGVFGRDVLAFHEDDATDPNTARTKAEKLVTTDQVDAIVGATGSGQCLTALEVAKQNSVFMVSGSCTSPVFSDTATNGGWFARTSPSDALQGTIAAYYARNESHLNLTNVAVIGTNDPYGQGLAGVFETNFERLGGNITIKRIIAPGLANYDTDLTAVMDTSPEAVYLASYPNEGLVLMAAWDVNPAWAATKWLFSEGLFDQTGFIDKLLDPNNDGDFSDGISYTKVQTIEGSSPSAYGGVSGPRYAAWKTDYNQTWSTNPTLFDSNSYDAVYLLALAAEAAGDDTGTAIKSKIRDVANPPGVVVGPGDWALAKGLVANGTDVDYDGASGSLNIDANGDPLSGYLIWGVDNGNQTYNKVVWTELEVDNLTPAPPARVGTRGGVEWALPARRD